MLGKGSCVPAPGGMLMYHRGPGDVYHGEVLISQQLDLMLIKIRTERLALIMQTGWPERERERKCVFVSFRH